MREPEPSTLTISSEDVAVVTTTCDPSGDHAARPAPLPCVFEVVRRRTLLPSAFMTYRSQCTCVRRCTLSRSLMKAICLPSGDQDEDVFLKFDDTVRRVSPL